MTTKRVVDPRGVEYHRGTPNTRLFDNDSSLVFYFDWDATFAEEWAIHALEARSNQQFAAKYELERFTEAISDDCINLMYAPVAACALSKQADNQELLSTDELNWLSNRYITEYLWREYLVRAHSGAEEALSTIRTNYPRAKIIGVSQCPWDLLLDRMIHTGLIPYFDGVVGVRRERPTWLEAEYSQALDHVDAWRMDRIKDMPIDHMRLIAGVPHDRVKPNRLHGDVVLEACGLTPGSNGVIIGVDDKPYRMAPLIDCYRGDFPRSAYVHAKVSTWEEADPNHHVDHSFSQMHELPNIIDQVTGRATVDFFQPGSTANIT